MKVIYRADDGREFDTEAACLAHEQTQRLMEMIPGYHVAQQLAAAMWMPFAMFSRKPF